MAVNVQETDWYKSRPAAVQQRIDEYPPGRLYRMRSTGHIVTLYSYAESADGTCTTCCVNVLARYNPGLAFERRVFAVSFDDLEDAGEIPE